MGCAQGKPSQGSPARSDGRGIDHLMRKNRYVPTAAAAAVDEEETPAPAPQPAPRREDELVDGWPTWLLDNVPREALQGIVPKSADAYDKIAKVGQGTYSNVYKARERGTGRVVALKKVRFDTSESESVRFMAREMMILRRLDHPNVIRLDGIATSRMHRSIYLVFDFMYSDLTRIICRPDHRLTEPQIKCYMQQLLSGLQHCHERGILHRDIKGSNLLIDRHGVLKIGDFGLANYYGRRRPLTSRVVTLWYRAPELLLGATDYGVGIDLWSAGCLLAEMFSGRPLMPGRTEIEQLSRIFTLCGSPPDDYWRKMRLPPTFRPPRTYKPSMVDKIAFLPPPALALLATLLALDPAARGTAAQALQSSFFSTPPLPCHLSELPVVYKEEDEVAASHDGRKPKLRERSHKRRDNKPKAEEQHKDKEQNLNSSPSNKEEKIMEDTKKSAQDSKRFSDGQVQEVFPKGSPAPQDQQVPRTNTYSPDNDHHKNHKVHLVPGNDQDQQTDSNHGSLEIRSASMLEYNAPRTQGGMSKQTFVDHV
ncbi:probable serine/threonine-protein kinase At1g54610 [Oryza glaberrima]|uniref:probable serine/threonine-protein kinase At1g54610 n=1 Tax=Oryza glaberrima TaxID=4538 RepID=UPI00224C321E|nr:probable serine/threonine-protein kinase At1g54610 [Oryza glaberrima]